jgi:hypothetical protein
LALTGRPAHSGGEVGTVIIWVQRWLCSSRNSEAARSGSGDLSASSKQCMLILSFPPPSALGLSCFLAGGSSQCLLIAHV